jgi:hypothetical protein
MKTVRSYRTLVFLSILLFVFSSIQAQQKSKEMPQGRPVMWEAGNVSNRDLFLGPGGEEMKPDLSKITFVEEDKKGHNKKFKIKDGAGRTWIAKLGREAQPETAAVRLLWGIGYKTETNYLVPSITIPGKGTFQNVRLEARPDDVKRLDEWKWKQNPFVGTNELQALKILMVFMTNWDVLDLQNKVLAVNDGKGKELQYIVSDMGSTFGRLGNNNLPIIYRFGRSVNNPKEYVKAGFIKGAKDGNVKLAYKGKNRGFFKGITVHQAAWLSNLMSQLSDKQISDAFRAANYSDADIHTLTQAVKRRIKELDDLTTGNMAVK